MVDLTGYRCLISVNFLSDIPENLEITVGDHSLSVLIQLERWGRCDVIDPRNPPNERTDHHDPSQRGPEYHRRSAGSIRGRRSSAAGSSSSDASWNSSEIRDRRRDVLVPDASLVWNSAPTPADSLRQGQEETTTKGPAIVGVSGPTVWISKVPDVDVALNGIPDGAAGGGFSEAKGTIFVNAPCSEPKGPAKTNLGIYYWLGPVAQATYLIKGRDMLKPHRAGAFGPGPVSRASYFIEGRGMQTALTAPDPDGLGVGDGPGNEPSTPAALGPPHHSAALGPPPTVTGLGPLRSPLLLDTTAGGGGGREPVLHGDVSVRPPGGLELDSISGPLTSVTHPGPLCPPLPSDMTAGGGGGEPVLNSDVSVWPPGGLEFDSNVVADILGSASWDRAPGPIPTYSTVSIDPHLAAAEKIHGSLAGEVILKPDTMVVWSPVGTVSGATTLIPDTVPLTGEVAGVDGVPRSVCHGSTRASVRLKSTGTLSVLDRAKQRKAFLLEGENSGATYAECSRNIRKVMKKSALCGVKLTRVEAEELHKFMMRG
uniref:Uncharacterized protein n=1 Tax=Ananas comosus var. bracteatus TaxID=296719 RepID=A0A6V7NY40_ANACO|nr:unnamed protein product [Ananas comosus var. bracteatus]